MQNQSQQEAKPYQPASTGEKLKAALKGSAVGALVGSGLGFVFGAAVGENKKPSRMLEPGSKGYHAMETSIFGALIGGFLAWRNPRQGIFERPVYSPTSQPEAPPQSMEYDNPPSVAAQRIIEARENPQPQQHSPQEMMR